MLTRLGHSGPRGSEESKPPVVDQGLFLYCVNAVIKLCARQSHELWQVLITSAPTSQCWQVIFL